MSSTSRTRSLSISEARRVALTASGFADKPPTQTVARHHLHRVMKHIKLLQLDTLAVVIRSQYLPAFSRLGYYDPNLLDQIAYRDDEWYETWAHEASLLPVTDEPLLRWQKQRAAQGNTWKDLVKLARREPAYIEDVLAQVRERPLMVRELVESRPRTGEWWGARSAGSMALDWLFRIGAVGIRRRGNFLKEFDLLERIVPAEVLARPTPSEAAAQRALLVQSTQALGVGTGSDIIDYYRLPIREGRTRLKEVCEAANVVEVRVEGWKEPAYMMPNTGAPSALPKVDAVTVLSPFDPVVWNRPRASRLWEFDYRIEIYVPVAKRVYGYYVLPVLYGEMLVGRVDVKTDRAARTLNVKAAFAEQGVDRGAIADKLQLHFEELARFVGVDKVRYGDRGNLMTNLRLS